MIGVCNRPVGVGCEVGTCFSIATHTESVTVIPGDTAQSNKRQEMNLVLCNGHEEQFHVDGLEGLATAFGDLVVIRTKVSKPRRILQGRPIK
jgi:hypothetical protein